MQAKRHALGQSTPGCVIADSELLRQRHNGVKEVTILRRYWLRRNEVQCQPFLLLDCGRRIMHPRCILDMYLGYNGDMGIVVVKAMSLYG